VHGDGRCGHARRGAARARQRLAARARALPALARAAHRAHRAQLAPSTTHPLPPLPPSARRTPALRHRGTP
jgi:hypothetical protein